MFKNPNAARFFRAPPARPPRIIIYGVGQYGSIVAKIALKKGWPIAGAVNRAGAKVGQDLGAVLGFEEALGVIIQDCETADYAAMDADIAIVSVADYLKETFPAYQRLLKCGINIICHAGQASYAWGADPALAGAIDALAKQNNATLTGVSLWDMSRVGAGLLVVGPCTDLSALTHTSITDVSKGGLHAMDFCGVGISEEEVTRKRSSARAMDY